MKAHLHILYKLMFTVVLFGATACSKPSAPVKSESQFVNAPHQLAKPYVVLVSLDGFRHDYVKNFRPPTLTALSTQGVQAKGLVPVYPSKTFPNHYSMATGLYADRHGLVSNSFYDPERGERYSIGKAEAVKDGRWYWGRPLWNVAAENKMVSASFFWVGSEAEINGIRPTYFKYYDKKITNEERVQTVLQWLKLPETERPHLILLYFSDVDSAGHQFGPASNEVKQAVLDIDQQLSVLRQGLKDSQLPVNLIMVSDHGMQEVDKNKIVYVDDALSLAAFEVIENGPHMMLYLKKNYPEQEIAEFLKAANEKLKYAKAFARHEVPAHFHFSKTARVGDIVIMAESPWYLRLRSDKGGLPAANHGWNPDNNPNMWGIFYAEGPAFKPRTKLKEFRNISVYPLVLDILDLPIPQDIDGDIKPLLPALRLQSK